MSRFAALLAGLVVGLGAATFCAGAVRADATAPSSSSPQPTLPSSASPKKPGSPVVEEIIRRQQPPLTTRKRAARAVPEVHHRRRVARRGSRGGRILDRPALAGVELVAPLPPPSEPPHVTVPVPAYPLESIAAAITTPPPPIVCHPARRDPSAPDPHLYREAPVECEPDTP